MPKNSNSSPSPPKMNDPSEPLKKATSLIKTHKEFTKTFTTLKVLKKEESNLQSSLTSRSEKVKSFDLIDFLSSFPLKNLNLSLFSQTICELKSAIDFFELNNVSDYADKAKNIEKSVKNAMLIKIYDLLNKNSSFLMDDLDFLKTLDQDMILKIKIRYLKVRKMKLLEKSVYFRSNVLFLIVQSVKQEIFMFFRMFNGLSCFVETLVKKQGNLFECFVFSFVRSFIGRVDDACKSEIFNALEDREFDFEKLRGKGDVCSFKESELSELALFLVRNCVMELIEKIDEDDTTDVFEL